MDMQSYTAGLVQKLVHAIWNHQLCSFDSHECSLDITWVTIWFRLN